MTTGVLRLAGVLLALWASAAAGAPEINAWLERSRIEEGESVQLTLEAPGRVGGRPDTAPLEDDFEVLGLSTGSRVSIVNGRTDARTTWILTLSPKRRGRLTVPPLRVGNGRSRALQLEVSATPPAAAGSSGDILLETELVPRRPYVQGQVLYTVRLLHAVPISGGELSEPTPENTLVQKLGEDRDSITSRNGRRYQVIERRYALFPQASGTLELAAPVFDGEVPDASRRRASPFKRFFGNDPFFGEDPFGDLLTPTRRVRVRGEPAELAVRARPAAVRGAHWLPAEKLQLHGEWQPAGGDIRVGEPVTLALQIEAQGLTGGQLPSPAPESVDGISVYPDQAQRTTAHGESGVTGRLEQKIAFIPRRAGELALPDIEVHWWDTHSDRERLARLPGHILQVLPATGRSTPAPAAPASAPAEEPAGTMPPAGGDSGVAVQPMPVPATGLWPWISAALAAGWLLTLVLFWWWRARRVRVTADDNQPVKSPLDDARTARRRFLAACEAHGAPAARRTLLEWAALHWPGNPPRGLEALAQRLDDPQARQALAELDRALYRKAQGWDGRRLRRRLQRLPQQQAVSGRRTTVLAPLYPDAQRHSRA